MLHFFYQIKTKVGVFIEQLLGRGLGVHSTFDFGEQGVGYRGGARHHGFFCFIKNWNSELGVGREGGQKLEKKVVGVLNRKQRLFCMPYRSQTTIVPRPGCLLIEHLSSINDCINP